MVFSVFILGVIAMTAQAVFLREILATFRGGELTVGIALFFWLLWTSAGSWLLGRFVTRIHDTEKSFYKLIPLYGFFAFAGTAVIKTIPHIMSLTSGELVSYDIQFMTVAVVFMPCNLLGGFLFALAVKALGKTGSRSAGHVFAIEALGSALAGLTVSVAFTVIPSNDIVALSCPVLGIIAVLVSPQKTNIRSIISLLLVPLLLTSALYMWSEKASWSYYRGQKLLAERDTKYGRLRITRHGEQTTFYSDAATLFSFPDKESAEYAVHIPMLASPNHNDVLILGGGPGGIIGETLKYSTVKRVTVVDLDPGLFDLSDRLMENAWRNDPRVEVIFTDGRAYLNRTDRQFDVIIMNMPAPLSGVTNRYYTAEFFRLCSTRLHERGILSFSLTGGENYISDDLASFLSSVRSTLRSGFKSVIPLPGERCRFLASKTPGAVDSLDWQALAVTRQELGIETDFVRDYYLQYSLTPLRTEMLNEALDTVENPEINSDNRPVGFLSRTIVQGNLDQSGTISAVVNFAKPSILIGLFAALIVFAALFAGLPGKGGLQRSVLVSIMSVGLTEISLEMLAIMAYQSIFGFLYGRIALLVGAYMGGLAVGAFVGTSIAEKGLTLMKRLVSIQAGIAVIPILWALVLWYSTNSAGEIPLLEIVFYILTAASGFAGGLQFPIADTLYNSSTHVKPHGPGAIYGADLAGSSVGAFVTASLMIPVLGMIPALGCLFCLNAVTAVVVGFRASGSH